MAMKRRIKAVVAVCDQCRREFEIEKNIDDQPDPDKPGVTQYGLRCPHCQHFTLSYRTNERIERLRKQMAAAASQAKLLKSQRASAEYERLQGEFSTAYNQLNPPKKKETPA